MTVHVRWASLPTVMAASTPATESPQSFETILEQLQQIVERLEQDDLPLEQSLVAFEQGVKLSRQGQQILDSAESKVEQLLKDGSVVDLDEPA